MDFFGDFFKPLVEIIIKCIIYIYTKNLITMTLVIIARNIMNLWGNDETCDVPRFC